MSRDKKSTNVPCDQEKVIETSSKAIQKSYIQNIPSFERDDDLTIVTTAEAEELNQDTYNNASDHDDNPLRSNQKNSFLHNERILSESERLDFDFSSMSIQGGEQPELNNNFSSRKISSLAVASSKSVIFNPQNNQSTQMSQPRRPSSLVSALTSNSASSYRVAPPPPGFVSPITVKSESRTLRNNLRNPDTSRTVNRGRFQKDSRMRGNQHDNYSNSTSSSNKLKFQGGDKKSNLNSGGVWGSTNQFTNQFNHDSASIGDNSYRGMPSVTEASSNSHSTMSDSTYLNSWKNYAQESPGRKSWNGTQTSFDLGGRLPPMRFSDEAAMANNDANTQSSLSTSYLSFASKGGSSYKSSTSTSSAVRKSTSPPRLYPELERPSSSGSSSYYSDCIEGPFMYGFDMYEEPKASTQSTNNVSFALPSLQEKNEHHILPAFYSSSSESDERLNLSLDEDANNISIGSQSTMGRPSRSPRSRKREWRFKMNRKLAEIPVGELNPDEIPISALMNEWAKTKSINGANMVESLLNRAKAEMRAGNTHPGVQLTTKMYTMAIDAWAKSKEGVKAAHRAENILQHMNEMHKSTQNDDLKPTTGIFNAVVNSWAQSKDKKAASRCEQILDWMDNLYKNGNEDVKPDTYTYNTVMHALAQNGGKESAIKALGILESMDRMYREGNVSAKPETISFNIVINALAKSKEKGAAAEAEKLLQKMQVLYGAGNLNVKPNVVSYCAVIDAYAKSNESGAASRGDTLLANMIQIYQSDPVANADLRPNTHVFNTLINCWSKSMEEDAASKAEEVLIAMSNLQENGIPGIKPDAFSYTAVIDAWAKSGHSGAALRAEALLNRMEQKYMAGDVDLKPTTYTYNAVIHSLAKSGEAQVAGRAEKVLQNMVNRYRTGGTDVMPTTINFNTVLGAWAKSNSGRSGAERAEKILEWMDELRKAGNADIKPDTISFNACIDAWARSGDKMAAERAEQILRHMDQLCAAGNTNIKADPYSYNTVLNAWAKSGEVGAPQRAERILSIMEIKYKNGDTSLKPNTRSYTTVIDAWAKSNERNSASKAEQILIAMQGRYENTNDYEARPNTATANAVMNSCAFTKVDSEKIEALSIAFRVFDWLCSQREISPDAYTYTIMLSVCSNLLPRRDTATRYSHAQKLFVKCRESGHVNDFVLRKLRHAVTEEEYMSLVDYRVNSSARNLPSSWTRNTLNQRRKGSSKSSKGSWKRR